MFIRLLFLLHRVFSLRPVFHPRKPGSVFQKFVCAEFGEKPEVLWKVAKHHTHLPPMLGDVHSVYRDSSRGGLHEGYQYTHEGGLPRTIGTQ